MKPATAPSGSIPMFNGNPTPPSSLTADEAPGPSSIPVQNSAGNPLIHFGLSRTPSTSSQSTEDGFPARSSAPNVQGGHRFYSERSPVPKVGHFPWGGIYRGPVGIYRSPMGPRQQRGSSTSTTSHQGIGSGVAIVESTPVSPTTDHQSQGGRSRAGKGHRECLDQVPDATPSRKSRRAGVEKKHARIVTDPITREE